MRMSVCILISQTLCVLAAPVLNVGSGHTITDENGASFHVDSSGNQAKDKRAVRSEHAVLIGESTNTAEAGDDRHALTDALTIPVQPSSKLVGVRHRIQQRDISLSNTHDPRHVVQKEKARDYRRALKYVEAGDNTVSETNNYRRAPHDVRINVDASNARPYVGDARREAEKEKSEDVSKQKIDEEIKILNVFDATQGAINDDDDGDRSSGAAR